MDPSTAEYLLANLPLPIWVEQKVVANCLQAAISTALIVDYIETLPAEVTYVWAAPWTMIKVLFLLARYSPFVTASLVIAYSFTESADTLASTCDTLVGFAGMFVVVNIALSEAIFFARIYALSGRSRHMLFYLSFQWIAVHLTQFVMMGIVVKSLTYPIIPHVTARVGCFGFPLPRLIPAIQALFSLSMFSGGVLLLIMGYLGFQRFRHARASNLMNIYFRDGILYFLALASLAIVNIVLGVYITGPSNFVIGECQGILYSMLSCRLLLHMRHVGNKSTATQFSDRNQLGRACPNPEQLTMEPVKFVSVRSVPLTDSELGAATKKASEYL
ncbi:hypothetical protein FA15DRAFT_760982 [Coprinopsis marcescibilis]|uniref:DUF6533 domain-containing protein n=1 Tax=Coprinopsis marcescibilis TaxID=230819 RepID=A0A5C3KCL6_COPMA|nr:hypothetical protein FA15DRAFT_760982 [Coprinopsis marcescibilis]